MQHKRLFLQFVSLDSEIVEHLTGSWEVEPSIQLMKLEDTEPDYVPSVNDHRTKPLRTED